MTTTLPANGRARKSLSDQIDRLDAILDGLAEALTGAVADTVREAVTVAVTEAVRAESIGEVLLRPPCPPDRDRRKRAASGGAGPNVPAVGDRDGPAASEPRHVQR